VCDPDSTRFDVPHRALCERGYAAVATASVLPIALKAVQSGHLSVTDEDRTLRAPAAQGV